MRTLKQSTAYDLSVFLTDSADHITGKTGLTLTITASKAGGAFASISPTVTERGSGWYSLALTTTHTNTLGDLALHITGSGADPADLAVEVRANVLGDTLPAAVQSVATDAITAAALAADAVTEIQSGLATAAALTVVDDFLDTEVAAILAAVDTEVGAIKAKTDNLPAAPAATGDIPTANAIADALLDRADGIETSLTVRQAMRLIAAASAGTLSGAQTTTITIRNVGNTKDRITATVDGDGNRTAVTTDVS